MDELQQEQDMPVEAPVSDSKTLSPEDSTMVAVEQDNAVESVLERPMRMPSFDLDLFKPDRVDLDLSQLFLKDAKAKPEYTGIVFDTYAETTRAIIGEETGRQETASDIALDVAKASDKIKKAKRSAAQVQADVALASTQSPEETKQVLTKYEQDIEDADKPVYLHEIEYAATEAMFPVENESLKQSLDEVKLNIRLAADLERQADELFENTSTWDLIVDFAELLSPTAAFSESLDKRNISQSDSFSTYFMRGGSVESLSDLIASAPAEQRESLLNQMVNDISEQETILFQNGNSLLQAGQIMIAAEILQQGIVGGEVTASEDFWSTIDVLTGYTAYGAAKGIKGLMRAFSSKFTKPDLTVDAAVKYRGQGVGRADFAGGQRVVPEEGVAAIVDRPANPVEAVAYNGTIISIEQAQKQLDQLDLLTTGKLSRKDRKALDAERKTIGDAIYRLGTKSHIEEVAQKYIARGKTRKDAMRLAKKDIAPELQDLQQQRQWLNDTIRQSDAYGRAEAEASRLRQAIQTQRMLVDPDSLGDTARGTIETLRPNTGRPIQLEMNADPQGSRIRYTGFAPDGTPNLQKIVQKGLTPDDVAQRAMPSMGEIGELKYTLFNPADVVDNIRDMSSSLLVDNIGNRILREGKEVEKNSGGNITYRPGNTLWRQNDDRQSVGDFQLFFGNGDGGFESAELARIAGNNVFGEQLEAVEIGGEWYLRKDFRHYFDARYDTTMFNVNQISGVGQWAKLFMNPLRLIGQGNLKEAWGALEAAKSLAIDVLQPAQDAIKKLSEKQKAGLSKLLYHGDAKQQVFTREEAYNVVFGELENGKVLDSINAIYDAYIKSRKVFDTHYEVLNQNVRNRMLRDNFKTVPHPNGEDSIYARKATDSEIEEAAQYLDVRTGQPISKAQLAELGEDVTIMRSSRPVDIEDARFDLVIVPNDKVQPLPIHVLNRRVGHVTRTYTDRKWKVVENVTEVVNGVPKTRQVTRAIMRLEGEANKIRNEFIANGKYAEENLAVTRTRENPDDNFPEFIDDLEHIGFGSNNAKSRGELLVGGNGNAAAIADPLESLAFTQFRLQREIGSDVGMALRERFMKTFREYLTPGTASFPRGEIPFAQDVPTHIQNKMKRMQDYILGMDSLEKGVVAKFISGLLEAFEESWFRKKGTRFARSLQSVVDADFQRSFMRFATYAFIVGRPLFQIPTNMIQALNIAMRYPVTGSVNIARSMFVFSALAARGSKDFPNMWKMFARTTGYDEKTMNQLLELIDESGIVKSTGSVDDFLGAVDDSLANFGRSKGILDKVLGGVKTVAGAPFKHPLRISAALQEKSINYVNMVALLTEFDEAVRAGKKLNAAGKADILMRTRRLTQTQNSLDQFGYQSSANPFQFMFQFVQHVNKIFFDIAVEPLLRSATGRGLVKGQESIYAESYGVALRTTAFTMILFGMNGLPIGQDNSRSATNSLRESLISLTGKDLMNDNVWFAVQGGLINRMISSLVGGKVDVTARISPSAYVDMITGMFDNGMSMDVLGAFGGVTNSVMDIGYANLMLLMHPEIDTYDKAVGIVKETYSFFASFKDVEKAYIAYNMLNHPYSNTLSGNMRVSKEQAIMQAFSINSDQMQEYISSMDFSGKKTKDTVRKVSEIMIRQMNRELTALKADGKLDMASVIATQKKWSEYAKTYVEPGQYDDVVKEFRIYTLTEGGEGFESFIRPFMDKTSFEEQRLSLMRLRERVPFKEWQDAIDGMLFWYNNPKDNE